MHPKPFSQHDWICYYFTHNIYKVKSAFYVDDVFFMVNLLCLKLFCAKKMCITDDAVSALIAPCVVIVHMYPTMRHICPFLFNSNPNTYLFASKWPSLGLASFQHQRERLCPVASIRSNKIVASKMYLHAHTDVRNSDVVFLCTI